MGYIGNWSTELLVVSIVNVTTNPTTYYLKDEHGNPIKNCFYESELQKFENPGFYLVEKVIKRKGSKFLVKVRIS